MNDWDILKTHEAAINKILCSGYQTLIGKHALMLKQGMKYISYVNGLKVLDAGSNHGVLSLVASRYCAEVVGVEYGKEGHNLGLKLLEYFRKLGVSEYNTERVRLINCRIGDIDEKFEGVMAYNVLYHLLPKELDRMTEIISQCSKIIVQSRKRSKSGVSDLHKPELIIAYLSRMGFRCEVEESKSPRPIILGSKI